MHFNGIVHRDLKPQNILLSSDFRLKLIDFGDSLVEGANEEMEKPNDDSDDMDEDDKAARDEEDKKQEFVEFRAHDEDVEEDVGYKAMQEYRGTFVGTPLYVAPEMLKESMSGHFTDLWALGCIVYQMATGDVPFKGTTDFQTFDIIMKRELEWPEGMDEDCKDLINRLLDLEPMRRLGAGRPDSGNSYEDLGNHPFFKDINWETVCTDPIPVDIKELKETLSKKQKLDIFDSDTISTDDMSTRQSEVNVVLEGADDFVKLMNNSKELKRGHLMKRNPWLVFQNRLFILTDQPRLTYFKDEDNFRGEIPLSGDTICKKI